MEPSNQAKVGTAPSVSRSLTRRQKKQLEERLWAPSATLGVGCILLVVVVLAAALLRVAHHLLGKALPIFAHDGWWITAVVVVAVATSLVLVFLIDPRGRREFDALLRRDLAEGVATVHRVSAVDAIEVEEEEDLGIAFFILTNEGETILFEFEGLDRYQRRGFPWTEFEIIEAPHTGVFLGLKRLGERLVPSHRRPPLTYEESKWFGILNDPYRRLDVGFPELKAGLTGAYAASAATGGHVRERAIRHSRFEKVLMLIVTAVFSTGFVTMYREEAFSLTSLVLGAGAVLGCAAIVQVFCSRIVLRKEDLRVVQPWSRKTYLRSDIRSVTWERGGQAVLNLTGERHVKLPAPGHSPQEVANTIRAWLGQNRGPAT